MLRNVYHKYVKNVNIYSDGMQAYMLTCDRIEVTTGKSESFVGVSQRQFVSHV